MEADKKVEMIQKAITNLTEDEEINGDTPPSNKSLVAAHEDGEDNQSAGSSRRRRDDQRQLLPKLLSELDSLEEDNDNTSNESINEEIIKELKNVKRQNSITHYLLTGLIVITLAWQLSEYSLFLKIKEGFSNPLKSVGGIFKGLFKNRREVNIQDAMKQASVTQKQVVEPTFLPGLKIPELPHLDFPGFDSSDDEDD